MFLAVDVGHTNTTCALFEDDNIVRKASIPTSTVEKTVFTSLILKEFGASLDTMIVASVVDDVNQIMYDAGLSILRKPPMILDVTASYWTIDTNIQHKETLGIDRLINCNEMWNRCHKAVLVLDLGSAVTYDVVNEEGVFIGGVISPGLRVIAAAMQTVIPELPKVAVFSPDRVVGNQTSEALRSGLYFTYTGMIEFTIEQIKKECPYIKKVVATGGDAAIYASGLNGIDEIVEDLTLYGLSTLVKQRKIIV